jgi:hypothetical protein
LDKCKTECVLLPGAGGVELPIQLETLVDRSLRPVTSEDKQSLFGTMERRVDYSLLIDFKRFYPEVRAEHDAAIQESVAGLYGDVGGLFAFGGLAGLFFFWPALSRLQRRRRPTQRQIDGVRVAEDEIADEAYDLLLAEHDAALEPLRVKSEEASRLTQDMWASVHIAEAQAESVKDDATLKARADAQIQHFRALLQAAEMLEKSANEEYRAKEELLRKYREAQVGQVRLALIADRQGDLLAEAKAVANQAVGPRVDTEGLEADAAARASSLADTETMEAMLELAAARIAAGH